MKRLIARTVKIAGWVRLDNERISEGPAGWSDPSATTCRQTGALSLDTVVNMPGYNNENLQWTSRYIQKLDREINFFGKYKEETWNEMVEEAKQTGIQYPIMINVDADGNATVMEGNHRIQLALQAGLSEIPAEVIYKGNSQREHKIT